MSFASPLRRAAAPLALLLALLSFFCMKDDGTRRALLQVRSGADFARLGGELLWPPWRALLAYVSIDDDVHLYYEHSRVVLGEEADAAYIAGRRGDATEADVALVRAELAQRRGWRTLGEASLGYPPLAAPLMLLPRLFADTLGGYRVAFAVIISLMYLGAWALALRIAARLRLGLEPRRILSRAALLTACCGPILVGRFDLLPALLTAAALWALLGDRPLLAGILLLCGAGAKLYPALLLPIWAALLAGFGGAARRRLPRLLAPFLALGVLGAALLLWRGGAKLAGSLVVFSNRPIQIESLAGSLLRVLGFGTEYTFGSVNVRLGAYGWLSGLLDLALLGGLVGLSLGAWRWARRAGPALGELGQRRALCSLTVVALLLILLTSKVFSPQYMIWCLPLCAVAPGALGAATTRGLAVALFLTQIYCPFLYTPLCDGAWPLLLLVLARNLLLAALLVRALRLVAPTSVEAPC